MKSSPLLLALLTTLVACGDPLVPPQTVIGLRVLGAKVSVIDEPTSSHVEPGQTADVQWLVVAEKQRSFRGLGIWCRATSSSFGSPPCDDPFEQVEFEGNTDAAVSLAFTLPEDFEVSDGWVHWIGLCESGTPEWRAAAQRFECSKGDVVSAVYRGNPSSSNANPNLSDDRLSFNGKSWSPPTDSGACGDGSVPNLDVSETAKLRLDIEGDDREALEGDDYAAPTRESLTFTHVTTWPGLDRPYSSLDGESSQLDLTFTSDASPPSSEGKAVRFVLVARDGRGGTDWLERWFCLQP